MFSDVLSLHSSGPYHMGTMSDSHAVGTAGEPGAGPYMKMYLKRDGDRVAEAWFETYGCPVAVGCGSWTVRWVEGRTLQQAGVLDDGALQTVLGGLPLGKEHCAALAVQSLKDGLRQLKDGA